MANALQSSGPISMSEFYDKRKTAPTLTFELVVVGGGGDGGNYGDWLPTHMGGYGGSGIVVIGYTL